MRRLSAGLFIQNTVKVNVSRDGHNHSEFTRRAALIPVVRGAKEAEKQTESESQSTAWLVCVSSSCLPAFGFNSAGTEIIYLPSLSADLNPVSTDSDTSPSAQFDVQTNSVGGKENKTGLREA